MSDKKGERCPICKSLLRNYWKEIGPPQNKFCPLCGHTAIGAALPQCDHPTACIVSSGEGPHYCGWCASLDAARAEERERCAALTEEFGWEMPEEAGAAKAIASAIRRLDDKEEPSE